MALVTLDQLLARLGALAMFVVLARVLEPGVVGMLGLLGSTFLVGKILIEQSIPLSLLQRDKIDTMHIHSAFVATLLLGCFFAVCMTGFLVYTFMHVGFAAMVFVIPLCILGFFAETVYSIPRALLSRELNLKHITIQAIIATIIATTVGITCAFVGYGVLGFALYFLVDRAVRLALIFFVSDWRPVLQFSKKHSADLLQFSRITLINRALELLAMMGPEYIIAFGLGPTALGYFVLARKITLSVVALFVVGVPSIGVSAFSRVQQDSARIARGVQKAFSFSLFLTLPAFVGLAILAEPVLVVFFGEKWIAAEAVLQILCITAVCRCVYQWMQAALIGIAKPMLLLRMNAVLTVFTLLTMMLVVSQGVHAVSSIDAARALFGTLLAIMLLQHSVGRSVVNIAQVLGIGIAVACMTLVVLLLPMQAPVLHILSATMTGSVVYAITALIFTPSLYKEGKILAAQLLQKIDT